MKLGLLVVLVGVMILAVGVPLAMAFHDADNLTCNSCHTMHYSEDGGTPPMPSGDASGLTSSGPNKRLLYYASITDLCLVCHRGDPGTTIGTETAWSVLGKTDDTPGGDFDNSATAGEAGQGHNPYLNDGTSSTLIAQDATLDLTPPGNGGTALTKWTCTSCHSPHGGSTEGIAYRNLKKTVNNGAADVDVSGTIGSGDTQEADLSAAYGATNHNVYWNGTDGADASKKFGAWCGACHGTFHGDESDTDINDGSNWIRHPTAYDLGSTIATNYGNTYLPDYPLVEDSNHLWTTDGAGTVSSDEEVFCLSCHKAHASANANATRWDMGSAAGSGTSCNKCHAKGS